MINNDLLLYPMGDFSERPVCDLCGAEMPLAKFEGIAGKPEFSTFRCGECSHSETFLAEVADRILPPIATNK